MVLYSATACRTVGPGDSGELTVVLSTWGVAHAPGYPLFSLIGNLVSAIPFPGEPAFLLNLLTSFFAALAGAVLAAAVIETTGSAPAGLVAGLALGTSRVFWEYALVVEVFALNSLFGALLLFLLARFLRGVREKQIVMWPLPAAALVASTAITHHLTLALLIVPVFLVFAAVLVVTRRRIEGASLRRSLLLSAVAALVGLLPLLYIPLAAHGNPVLNWDDARTTRNVIRLLKREDFGSGTLMSPWAVATTLLDKGPSASPLGGRHFRIFWAEIPRDFGWIFTLFAVLGALWAALRSRWAILLLAGFVAFLAVFFLRVNSPVLPLYQGVTERFYILPHVVVAFFGGLGMAWGGALLKRRHRHLSTAFFVAASGVTAALMAFVNGPEVSMRANTFTRDFGANFLEGIPQDAIVLSEGDLFHNAFYYQQACLNKRPDLEFIDQQKLTYSWYVDQVRRRNRFQIPPGMTTYSTDPATHTKAWLDLNLKRDRRAVVAVAARDESWFEDYRMVPMGLWWRFYPRDEVPSPPDAARSFETIAARWNLSSLNRRYHERSWETAERPLYTQALGHLSGMLDLAEDVATGRAEPEPDPGARAWLDRAVQVSAGDPVSAAEAHLEVYHRALAEQTIDFAPLGGPLPLIRKTILLAERAAALDPGDPGALMTLVALLRADAASYDPGRELELRGRIVDLSPGDDTELTAYVQLAINLLNDPAHRDLVRKSDLIRRENAFLERLELAIALSDEPSLKQQRDQWRGYLQRTQALP
jgi:hypothetical protein